MDITNLILLATETVIEHAPIAAAEAAGPDVLGKLGIDWRLFAAQLVNFAVVLFVLWRWVFEPVGGALEARRQKIEESVLKAEVIQKQMQEADVIREQKLREARVEAESIIKRTSSEAEKAKQETILAAKSEADKIMTRAKDTIEAEKQQMLKEVKTEVADLIVVSAEKILRQKLDEKSDRKIVEEILKGVK